MAAVCRRHGVGEELAPAFGRLLDALASEAGPPTTVSEPAAALDAHVADSLSGLVVPELRSARAIADVGAGAGFPGLVLALALPAARVDLIESVERKCETIRRVAGAAEAANAHVVAARAEEWARAAGAAAYDAVTARAVAPLPVLCEYAAPLLPVGGVLVCWKGARRAAEEEAGARAAEALGMRARAPLPVEPFPAAHSRQLHVFVKAGATPARFPRRPGVAAKRPLGA